VFVEGGTGRYTAPPMITMADAIRPVTRAPSRARGLLHELLLVLAGSALIALSAWVAIPLPFSPVPVTAQTLAVLFVGSALGARRGAAAALAYLAEGSSGLPVFAGGSSGIHVLVGPTGGYLAGFVLGAYLCGALAERGFDRSPVTTVTSMALGNVGILLPGLLWLSRFVGPDHVLRLGLFPFIPGDLVKIALAAALLPLGWKLLDRSRSH